MSSTKRFEADKAEIKQRLMSRLGEFDHAAMGSQTDGVEFSIDSTVSADYQVINSAWSISSAFVPRSLRPVVGPLVTAIKRAAYWAVRGYLESGWGAQAAYNGSVTRILNHVARRLTRMDNVAQQLAQEFVTRIEALEHQASLPVAIPTTEVPPNLLQGLAAQVKELQNQVAALQATQEAREAHMVAEVDWILAEGLAREGLTHLALSHLYRSLRHDSNQPERLALAGELFRRQVARTINTHGGHYSVAIVVEGLLQYGLIEAIKKEAWNHYNQLRKAGVRVSLVSVEDQLFLQDYVGEWPHSDVQYVAPTHLSQTLRLLSPSIVHLFEASPEPLFRYPALMEYPVICTAVSNGPLHWMGDELTKRLSHLADQGRFRLVVESNRAQESAEHRGIGYTKVVRPPVYAASAMQAPERFTVGFASSPMQIEQWNSRGIDELLEAAARLPEAQFVIAWRNLALPIRERIESRNLKNVTVKLGHIDMEAFYREVSAVVIPFTTAVDTHACPLSALEGLGQGRPVVCTSCSGVADVVNALRGGVVVEPTGFGLAEGIAAVRDRYAEMTTDLAGRAQEFLSVESHTQAYVHMYQRMVGEAKGITLDQWAEQCATVGKRLVVGREEISRYYLSEDVASSYDAERFARFPMNCYDLFEREAVKQLILTRFEERRHLNLLDVATGTGRILKELLPFGRCTAIDSSVSMMRVAMAEVASAVGISFVKGDFFDTELPGAYDVITAFRYVRHFTYQERRTLYARLHKQMAPQGICILDFPNRKVEVALRDRSGWGHFHIYDVSWTLPDIKAELRRNGFEIVHAIPVGEGLLGTETGLPDEPVCWTVAFTRYQQGDPA